MHDETCIGMARVLGERDDGFPDDTLETRTADRLEKKIANTKLVPLKRSDRALDAARR